MNDDENLLFNAAYGDDCSAIEAGVKNGLDPDFTHPRSGHTPLQAACETDSLGAIDTLLKLEANPNKKFTKVSRVDGRVICKDSVALMHVLSVAAAKLLIEFGADPAEKDGDGLTAVDWALKDNNDELVQFLSAL